MRTTATYSVVLVVVLACISYSSSDKHVLADVPLQAQISLRGGCDIDCEVPNPMSNCYIKSGNRQCYIPEHCEWPVNPDLVCADTTADETCTKITDWGIPCLVLAPHDCWPLQFNDRTCVDYYCGVHGPPISNCGPSVIQCIF